MLTELQKRTAQAIVNIFETGSVLGDYAKVTLLAGDSGQLTYGRSQTTLGSGNLYFLLKAYCDMPSAGFAAQLRPYLDALLNRDPALNADMPLRTLLKEAGDDPFMRECQDGFFDRVYWSPAVKRAADLGIGSALGTATVYDSVVHGSWALMRDETVQKHGTVASAGEESWIAAYIGTRRAWLANHSNALLRKTVYRMDALNQLVQAGQWPLRLPFSLRGRTIDEATLTAGAEVRASAEIVEERNLRLQAPFMRGDDVMALQQRLAAAGFALKPDGIFGRDTQAALIAFQRSRQLVADGIAGPATRAALGV